MDVPVLQFSFEDVPILNFQWIWLVNGKMGHFLNPEIIFVERKERHLKAYTVVIATAKKFR